MALANYSLGLPTASTSPWGSLGLTMPGVQPYASPDDASGGGFGALRRTMNPSLNEFDPSNPFDVNLDGNKYVRVGDFSQSGIRPDLQGGLQTIQNDKYGTLAPYDAFSQAQQQSYSGDNSWLSKNLHTILPLAAAAGMGGLALSGAGTLGAGAELAGGASVTGGGALGAGAGVAGGGAAAGAGGAATAAGGTALSRILEGKATDADWANILGTGVATGLGVVGSRQQAGALTDIANRSRADRAPYLSKANEYLANPEAYGAGPGQAAMKSVLQGLSAKFGNPIGSGTALGIATDAGLRDWRNAVTGFANLGLAGEDTRANLEAQAAGANANVYGNIAGGISNVINPEPSLEELYRKFLKIKTITGGLA